MRALGIALGLFLLAPALAAAQDAGAAPTEDPEPGPADTPAAPEAPPADEPPTAAQEEPVSPPPSRRRDPAPAPAATSAPPPATPPPAEEEEEAEEEEDDGDPYDFLWIDLSGGVSYIDMRALSENNFYPEFVRLSGVGGAASLGVGFRIEFFAAGIRGTIASYGDGFDVGTAVGEVTIILPIPVVKPWFRAGFGFGWHGDGNFNAPRDSQTTVFGWAFSGAAGIDIYLAHWFAIGAGAYVDILNMSRQSINEPVGMPGDVEFTDPGDAVGVQIRGQVGVTFHL